jgi:F-type H+-transporting ATPase subunit b
VNLGLTLLGQMITFAIFVWFTMRFVWPALEQALEERRKKIADGLAAAEKGQNILADAAEQTKVELKQAREKCNELIASASKQAQQILENAKRDAQQERDNILASGRDRLKHEVYQAKTALQTQLADIVVLGAEKILTKSINAADHKILLEKLAKEMAG